ncbi:MAG: glycosyl hydrolase family 65 protein [Bacteroidales bacterium]|nr:glycosyl hydrolase family 65 protein [Bacteroidales bacterium]
MNPWNIQFDQWNAEDHPAQEALCALGNGYIVTRGALEQEKDNGCNYPGTYLAGGYNRITSKIHGKEVENEDLVNWPNWLYMTFRIGNSAWFSMDDADILDYVTTLNMQEGILLRKLRFRDKQKRITTLISRRLVSMDDYHLAGIEWTLIPENWSGKLTIRSGIDGKVINNNVARYRDLSQDHLTVVDSGSDAHNRVYLTARTKQSDIRMTQAARTTIVLHEKQQSTEQRVVSEKGFIAGDYRIRCAKLEPVRIEKIVAVYTSRDTAISDPLTEALSKLRRTGSFSSVARRQKMAWQQIWDYNDMLLDSSDEDQRLLRMHIFHLYQTVSKNSMDYDIGVPARGWHGEAYRGHVFWDELYILPFIDLHYPQLSRSLLLYRYRRLPEAYALAASYGFRGALFPWQSGSNGREETQKIHLNPESGRWLPDVSHLQYHINAAVAYNVWHYYQSSGDMDFLHTYGAEIIMATALFWSDLVHFNPQKGRYEIHGVMGPDEYHTHYPDAENPGLNNNAYTNVMAVWVLRKALELYELLDRSCCDRIAANIGINDDDLDTWKEITEKMFVPFHDSGIISQFEGYEKLKELDWDYYREKYGEAIRLDRILESKGDSPNYYKASKQADVLMLYYLFSCEELTTLFSGMGYEFDPESIPRTIEYYHQRTAHGSTLSQVIHAWVYARSHRDLSWKSFKKALVADYKDVQGGTTHEGIHLGAMAGTLDLLQRCYSGMEIRDHVLWLNPRLPDDIGEMSFRVRFRNHWIKLTINREKLKLDVDKGWAENFYVGVRGKTYSIKTGDHKEFRLSAASGKDKR